MAIVDEERVHRGRSVVELTFVRRIMGVGACVRDSWGRGMERHDQRGYKTGSQRVGI